MTLYISNLACLLTLAVLLSLLIFITVKLRKEPIKLFGLAATCTSVLPEVLKQLTL
ncbi:hypothetical protein [Vibrio alginolyticus]|uniref:hypothetical protein n=1 Tax=Vibrio alginolyticus TaxID=663 RepID=UPI001BD679F4|nr:hypothetical protein [Vibrio alginolyticus]MBS9995612.1 hypothetical protein [Vibrio alginolyticus]